MTMTTDNQSSPPLGFIGMGAMGSRMAGRLLAAGYDLTVYNRKRERAVWLDIPTHRVTSNFVWQLPFGRGQRYLSRGRLGDQRRVQYPLRPVPDGIVDRAGPDRHGVYGQPHAGPGDHPPR